MAGRGRGRGRGKFTFDLSKVGIQKGEALPASIQQPPPLFPPLAFKPVPLSNSEADDYLLALKQEFRGIMQESVYFIKPDVTEKDVVRYSDKYREQKPENDTKWEPDWSRFPDELKEKSRKPLPRASLNRSRAGKSSGKNSDVTKQLNELGKKTGDEDDEEDDEVEEGRVHEYDEEDQEEDNDYLVSHYDEGDEVGFQDDDDMDEGPIY